MGAGGVEPKAQPRAKSAGAHDGQSGAAPGTDGGPAAPNPTDGAGSSGFGGLSEVPYHPPLKRSMTIAGHQTSISLEPMFWAALEEAARRRGVALSALVAEVDVARLEAARVPNLTSALRQYLFGLATDRSGEAIGAAGGAGEP